MRQPFHSSARPIAMFMIVSLALVAGCKSRENPANVPQATREGEAQPKSQANFDQQRQNAEKQTRPEVEKERQTAQDQANQTLDQDAIAAINQTQNAIEAISQNKKNDALAAIEAATGKINILLARNAKAALIPVASEVEVIDAAPLDEKAVQSLNHGVSEAVKSKDYPTARLLLYSLESEIRTRTYDLPLATYPVALQEAARLLDQGKNDDASKVLGTALNTLVVVDKVTPVPVVLARAAIAAAEEQRQKDKNAAQTLLATAKEQLHRCQELGYAANTTEYSALNTSIAQLDTELKGNGDTTSLFAKLKDELSPLFNRQSAQERR
ncbi:YfdX family protein [Acidobacteria bacterium AB60]|nr:YfdX family protein [Acidobacteria bacterium AB60]